MSEDLIRRSDAIEAIEGVDWYHQNKNKDMVSGANSDEHQAWYKADDVYKALEAIPTIEPKRGWWETVFMSEATGWDVSIAGRDPIYGHRCSICKEETFNNDVGEEMLTNFCPYCGARMKGADDE